MHKHARPALGRAAARRRKEVACTTPCQGGLAGLWGGQGTAWSRSVLDEHSATLDDGFAYAVGLRACFFMGPDGSMVFEK